MVPDPQLMPIGVTWSPSAKIDLGTASVRLDLEIHC